LHIYFDKVKICWLCLKLNNHRSLYYLYLIILCEKEDRTFEFFAINPQYPPVKYNWKCISASDCNVLNVYMSMIYAISPPGFFCLLFAICAFQSVFSILLFYAPLCYSEPIEHLQTQNEIKINYNFAKLNSDFDILKRERLQRE